MTDYETKVIRGTDSVVEAFCESVSSDDVGEWIDAHLRNWCSANHLDYDHGEVRQFALRHVGRIVFDMLVEMAKDQRIRGCTDIVAGVAACLDAMRKEWI